MFTQTIQAGVLWQTRAESKVLVFKDNWRSRGVEENFAALASYYGEAKWIFFILELEVVAAGTCLSVGRTLENRVWDLIDLIGRILDLDVQSLVFGDCQLLNAMIFLYNGSHTTLVLHGQSEFLKIGAIGVARSTSQGERRSQTTVGGFNTASSIAGTRVECTCILTRYKIRRDNRDECEGRRQELLGEHHSGRSC